MARQNQDGSWTYTPEENLYLNNRRQVADFSDSLFNDPALNKDVKAIIKRKYPNIPIPDYDIEQRIEGRFAERDNKEREAAESKKQAEDNAKFQEARSSTQKKYGLTDEAMERLESMMVEKNIGDYDAAATYFASKEPKTSEASWDESRWHHEKAAGFDEIAKDPEAWGRTQILSAIRKDQENSRGGR